MDEKKIGHTLSKLDVNTILTDPRSWINFKDKKREEYFAQGTLYWNCSKIVIKKKIVKATRGKTQVRQKGANIRMTSEFSLETRLISLWT